MVFNTGAGWLYRDRPICPKHESPTIFVPRMTDHRFAILDPAAGISGDMLLGALIDVGAPPEWLATLPSRLGYAGVEIGISRVKRCGIAAAKVNVRLADGRSEPPSPAYVAAHEHAAGGSHSHDHAHPPRPTYRSTTTPSGHHHLGDLVEVIARAQLSDRVKALAIRAFEILCQAEGVIHGVPTESVALHELGAVENAVIRYRGRHRGL